MQARRLACPLICLVCAALVLAACSTPVPQTLVAESTSLPVVVVTAAPSATPPPSDTPRPTSTAAPAATATSLPTNTPTRTVTPSPTPRPPSPLSVEYMRKQAYPGSELKIEQTLAPGANYSRHIASYQSEGLKIYGLLTVPNGPRPRTGWPIIVFNHGYIAPTVYRTTERYVAYQDAFARNGYITFKSDYRGHGSSEGRAEGGYGSPAYTIDVLNAMASVKRMPEADPNRIGMWGHSMGGSATLRAMVVSKEIKAGVIWAGVVASYPDLISRWRRSPGGTPLPNSTRGWRGDLVNEYGSPEENPEFWASISPNSYLSEISGPLQLHHGTADTSVPLEFSQTLAKQMQAAKETVELYTYAGDDHNIAPSFNTAMSRSVAFFDRYVKGN